MKIKIKILTIVGQIHECIGGRSADIPITVLEHVSDLGNGRLEGVMEESCD